MAYPFKQATRAGAVTPASTAFDKMIKDVSVIGAEPGKYYQIAYYQNGALLNGVNAYGMIIKEFNVATFGTTGAEVRIQDLNTTGPYILRNGGIQKIVLYPPARPNMRIELVVDGNAIPPFGTPINANSSKTQAGWSTIIDPACYNPAPTGRQGPLHVIADASTKMTSFVWSHGSDKMLKVSMKPNAINALFNIRSVQIANNSDVDTATWTTISDVDTDWIPPLVVQSTAANVDANATSIYTGGAHGTDGGGGGTPTARMIEWSCQIDDKNLSGTYTGPASRVVISWCNELKAWNTWNLPTPRYVLRQYFTAIITQGNIEVWADYQRLEECTVSGDNALQLVPNGYTDYYFYGGQPGRVTTATNGHSGLKQDYPDAWATVQRHSTYGFQVAWMDRTYGVGNGSFVASTQPFMRKGGTGNNKLYHAAVAGTPLAVSIYGYQWHGGYSWSPITSVTGYLDSSFIYIDKNKPKLAYANLATGSGQIFLPSQYIGCTVGTDVVGARRRIGKSLNTTSFYKQDIET